MQQTKKYKLNLIEPSDTFSPDALNANTQKVEDVLSENLEPLDARVTVLEAHKFVYGTYCGTRQNGTEEQFVPLPFTPKVVIAYRAPHSSSLSTVAFSVATANGGNTSLTLLENGFQVRGDVNLYNSYYNYVAFA